LDGVWIHVHKLPHTASPGHLATEPMLHPRLIVRRDATTQAAAVAVSAKPSLAAYGEGANIFGAKTKNSGEGTTCWLLELQQWSEHSVATTPVSLPHTQQHRAWAVEHHPCRQTLVVGAKTEV
jgi:hypothetical protein